MTQLSDLPLREELRGQSAYGAPQLKVANQLNTNENPYAPSQAIIDEIAPCFVERDAGEGREGDIEKMLDLCENIGGRSFCALADGAVACLTSAIKYFREEFEQGFHTPAWELFPYERSALFAAPARTATTGAHA